MSKIKVNSLEGVGASTPAISIDNASGTCTANITNNLSNRNLIINGAMQVAQRGTSQTGVASSGYKNACDRWRFNAGGANVGAYTVSQSTTSPDGFGNSLKIDCTTARTPTNNEFYEIAQRLEGQNLQAFAKGTSASKKYTLSFYVKTNVNGNYVVWLYDNDNNRMVGGLYTVSNSNWNRYTISYPADTTGGFDNNNERSLDIRFVLLAGTDFTSGTLPTTAWATYAAANSLAGQTANVASSTSNEFYLTGVQLEVDYTGSGVATDFEFRSYHDESQRCYRYYYQMAPMEAEAVIGETVNYDTTDHCLIRFPVEMRAEPSLVVSNFSNAFRIYGSGGGRNVSTLTTNTGINTKQVIELMASGGSNGNVGFVRQYSISGSYPTVAANAEL